MSGRHADRTHGAIAAFVLLRLIYKGVAVDRTAGIACVHRFTSLLFLAAPPLPLVFGFAFRNSLPLHIARRIRTAARERDDMIHHVTRPAIGMTRHALKLLFFCLGASFVIESLNTKRIRSVRAMIPTSRASRSMAHEKQQSRQHARAKGDTKSLGS